MFGNGVWSKFFCQTTKNALISSRRIFPKNIPSVALPLVKFAIRMSSRSQKMREICFLLPFPLSPTLALSVSLFRPPSPSLLAPKKLSTLTQKTKRWEKRGGPRESEKKREEWECQNLCGILCLFLYRVYAIVKPRLFKAWAFTGRAF